MQNSTRTIIFILGALTALFIGTGCSSKEKETGTQSSARVAPMGAQETDEDTFSDLDDDYLEVSDPLEPVNRAVFAFNDKAYDLVIRPLTSGYKKITPEPVRKGIGNFFTNLAFPVRFVSSTLQGKLKRAGQETGKFLINTTAGGLGFVKVSDDIDGLANIPSEDLGQTLGAWGIDSGPYVVLPILGPSSVRDLVGNFGDSYIHPYAWAEDVTNHWEWEIEWALRSTEIINGLPGAVERYDRVKDIAIDPYISIRDAYMQNREREVGR